MFSRLYGSLMNARNSLYEKGVFAAHPLGAPAFSVGNITTGGTGKTPLVAFIAEVLADGGERICILTRGYGRENPRRRILVSDGETITATVKSAGDEPFELANRLLGKAVIVADADRVAAAHWAREKFGVTCFVLDDAFQHRRAGRDADIVCVDATNPFGNGKTLPSGILREPLENLKRADAIVITRANLADDISNLKSQISKYNPHCRIFISGNKVSRLIELEKFPAKAQSSPRVSDHQPLTADRCLAFCALGNPNNFFEQLRQEKYNLVAVQKFPDHHFYTPDDITELSEKAEQDDAEILLTTAKDAVKLRDSEFDVPCYVVESELVFENDSDFRRWLASAKK